MKINAGKTEAYYSVDYEIQKNHQQLCAGAKKETGSSQ